MRGLVRVAGGGAVLALVVWRVGTGPLVDGARSVDARTLALAAAIAVVTTVCCAWRWRLVARGLGLDVPMRGAVAAYYRSQFLNSTLPGGVVGDVHRGVRHGRDVEDVGLGLRAVGWERLAGQAVQVALTAAVLLALPSPAQPWLPRVAAVVAAVAGLAVATGLLLRRSGRRWTAPLRTAASDVRLALLSGYALPRVALASAVVVTGHVATFLVAARAVGSTAPPTTLLPLAVLVLLAMSLPLNVAGWGPREGMAAWAFAAAGLGAAQGVAAAAAYGVLAFVACLPGGAVLAAEWLRRQTRPVVVEEAAPPGAPPGLPA